MAWITVPGWAGRAWRDRNGVVTFHIRREGPPSPDGKRNVVEKSTRAHTLQGALAELARFEAATAAGEQYAPRGPVAPTPIVLDEEMIASFTAWSETSKRNTKRWVEKQRRLLRWWAKGLDGRDLRRLDLKADVDPLLKNAKGRAHRIEVIRALFGWLRRVEHRIEHDPVASLAVPQARPEQWKRSKVISREDEARLLTKLDEADADVIRLLSATGMHTTEAVAFAGSGEVEERGGDFVLKLPHSKSGGFFNLAIDAATAEVAKRVRSRGGFYLNRFFNRVAETGLGVTPGRFRHSFATRMIEAGADPATVAAYLHHAPGSTTLKRFYATHAVRPRPAPRPI